MKSFKTKRSGFWRPLLSSFALVLFSHLVALLEAFYSTSGIHDSSFTGEERMAFAAKLDSKLFLSRTSSIGIAAGAYYLSIGVIFRMNLIFHFYSSA